MAKSKHLFKNSAKMMLAKNNQYKDYEIKAKLIDNYVEDNIYEDDNKKLNCSCYFGFNVMRT